MAAAFDSATCAQCSEPHGKCAGAVNRARKLGVPLFCGQACFGLSRRKHKTKAQKVAEKKAYDEQYRAKNAARLKAEKAAYFQRTYDPVKAAKERKATMARHVEYCRQPKYKKWKSQYDRQYRAREYGAFAEVYLLAIDLNREIKQRASNYEIRRQNETGNKRQERRRAETSDRNAHSQA